MRPSILFPLFRETRTLAGVGPKLEKLIARVAGTRLLDLVFDLPVGAIDRSYRPKLKDAEPGRIATVEVAVCDHLPSRDPRFPYKVRCADETAYIELVFFRVRGEYLKNSLPTGSKRIVSGRIERYREGLQIVHPDFIELPDDNALMPLHEPVYALTEGLSNKMIGKAVRQALLAIPEMPEWLDTILLKTRGWPSFRDAIISAHAPQSERDLSPQTAARMRLAYDELLANQLALVLIRARMRGIKGRVLKSEGRLKQRAFAALPFALTASQKQAIAEIEADMAQPSRMLRLLQGDVGSGKTLVAMAALLNAVEGATT